MFQTNDINYSKFLSNDLKNIRIFLFLVNHEILYYYSISFVTCARQCQRLLYYFYLVLLFFFFFLLSPFTSRYLFVRKLISHYTDVYLDFCRVRTLFRILFQWASNWESLCPFSLLFPHITSSLLLFFSRLTTLEFFILFLAVNASVPVTTYFMPCVLI